MFRGSLVYAERMEKQTSHRIWIDADTCPRPILKILYRASERKRISLVLVANRSLSPPESPLISTLQVDLGPDMADHEIVARVSPRDLVVTGDHILALLAVKKGAICIDHRGTLYTLEKVHERVNMRSLKEVFRNGVDVRVAGQRPFSAKHRQAFANQLEAYFRQAGI